MKHNSRRLLAFLLCLCMVLVMVPSNFAFLAKAENAGELAVDANGMAFCPACNQTVKWSPFSSNARMGSFVDGTHRHYYLTADINAAGITNSFVRLSGTNLCLHLNGHDLTYGGYMQAAGSTLNIMGTGDVIYTGTAPANYDKFGIYITSKGVANLMGGNYSVADTALEAGVPTIHMVTGTLNVGDITVSGWTELKGGTLNLDKSATMETILVTTGAKLNVKKTWTGSAQANFDAGLVNNLIPEKNGAAEGAFTGKLTMANAVTLNATAEGRLQASGFNAGLVLDENNQAMCNVCNQTVTWESLNEKGGLGTLNDGAHHHFYLTAALDKSTTASSFGILQGGSKACLHLNGFNLTHGSYLIVGKNCTLNVLGVGNVNFTATTTGSEGTKIGGLYAAGENTIINLYGGTYSVSETAVDEGRPSVYQLKGEVNVKNAVINGEVNVQGGTLTLEEGAVARDIQIASAGKLYVKKNWTGSAAVAFAVALENGVVPAANGGAEGVFTGTLTRKGGRKLEGTAEGALKEDDPNKNLVFDENKQAFCPKCEEMVTWTALTGSKTFNGGNHHYYLSNNLNQSGGTNFIRAYNGAVVCLHLNGHNITHGSRMFIQAGATLSIMGHGDVTYTATGGTADSKIAGIRNSGNVNLLGGTYKNADVAVAEKIPYLSQASGAMNVENATVTAIGDMSSGTLNVSNSNITGTFTANGGTMTIDGAANFQNLQVGTGAKLIVKKSWTGAAKVNFLAGLEDNKVPAANGVAEGVFTGNLTTIDGSKLEGFADGTIRKVIKLELDANKQGYCPACDATVTWTAWSGTKRLASYLDGKHRHVYLDGDVTYENGTSSLFRLGSGSNMCLHLNDHNITTGSYMDVSASVLNIMGTGNLTFTASASQTTGYWKFGFYPRSNGTVNLMGGTYFQADSAAELNAPLVYQLASTVTLGDVILNGQYLMDAGTLNLSKTATLNDLKVKSGKINVQQGWAGIANVDAALSLMTTTGTSTGTFIGGLVLSDGTLLKGEGGKLVVNDYKELIVDENHRGYCKVCGNIVTWNPVYDGQNVGTVPEGAHAHYYFAADNFTAKNGEFVYAKEGSQVCIHLNNKTASLPGRIRANRCTLNIMGDGKVDFLASTATESYNSYLLYCQGSPYTPAAFINVYGGTFTSSAGKPIAYATGVYSSVNAQIRLRGNTRLEGNVSLDQAHVYLYDDVVVESITASNTGSVRVDGSWNGTAKVSYLADMFEEYLNVFNGRSYGEFMGGLLLADGRRLIGESGRLRIVAPDALYLNNENKGYCYVCNKVVDWTAIKGSTTLGSYAGGHQHIYLTGDVEAQTAATFLKLSEGADLCLHLNGHDITHGSAMIVENGSALNIIGNGNVAFTGTNTQSLGGIENAGDVNLLGGTYAVQETAATEKLSNAYIYQTEGKTTVKNAVINSNNQLTKGTLVLDGSASLKAIHIEAAGLLVVEDTWTGSAAVEFANGLTGKYAPSANVTLDKATGKLTLLDGRPLSADQNGIAVEGLVAPEKLNYKLYDTHAEIWNYTGEGVFLLPAQISGKPVTKIANGAFANFTGTLYIGKGNTYGLSYAKEAGLTYTEIAAINGETGYATVAEALSAYSSGVVQLLTDAGNVTVAKDTYLDLNGFDVADATVTGGTLYVMDSQTDDFTVADGNYGKITGKISGAVKAVPADAACAENGYLQVTQEDGISFHCIAMDIYGMTLRSDVAGVYYEGAFAGDEVVAPLVKSYGVALSVYGDPDETRKDWCYTEYTDFAAGENSKGTLLKNVMKSGLSDTENLARANTPVYGRAYIKTENGYVFGKTICRDLQEQVELADQNWEAMTKTEHEQTRAMYETYQTIMDKWDINHTPKYVDRVWFDEEAPDTGAGWEQYSLPLGNGYLGTSVFGGTETETLVFADKTMYNPTSSAEDGADLDIPEDETYMGGSSVGSNGFTDLCKLKIDFGHNFDQVTNYERDLLLDTAEARVMYDYKGVTYNRTYFANYPDNVTVAKLDASHKGALSFTLRPTPTHVRDHLWLEGDGLGKTGTVTASGDTAILSGTLAGYQINYEIQFKVIPVGGTMKANADGTITVTGADSAVILITAGTNHRLNPETMTAPNKEKLDPNEFPHDKVTAVMTAASKKSYEELLATHLEDYQGIYGRVEADLNGEPSTTITTDKQMQAYRAGTHTPYLEELLFKHGRYLLIASSREGTLPANLQGMWQYYAGAAWRGGYVYNINLQMNYWSCYATNLLDMFETNFEYFDAMWDTLEKNADNYLTGIKSPYIEETGKGLNGIAIGASGTPYTSAGVTVSGAHSGPATTAYTTSLLWEYYEFTGDKKALEEKIWPYIEGCAIFLDKTLIQYGDKWLVSHSASPENNMWFGNGAPDGPKNTVGTMFDQMFVYETFCQVLEAAEILGYTEEDAPILKNIHEKLDKLDHVIVGKSGHVKEYREEEFYGEFGRYEHHGMAQLVGVYPATSINSSTDAWQDAATVTATERGINYTGHQSSFKQLVWARLGNSDYAYLLAQDHITKYLRDNLWNTHTPFQIDGNFGYTAGVAEMLVQSHENYETPDKTYENYISVLPALPKAWAAIGNFSGLTARGGFEVGAVWKDGNASQITITSLSGNDATVKYFNISTAKVTDSKGNVVPFTVVERDMITFATVAGETYTITNLSDKVVVTPPSALVLTNGTTMTWKASPDAVSYNVYRAVNSDPSYTLVAKGITGTSYSYVPTDLKAGDQLILRVTAVNAAGVESTGIRELTWDFAVNEEDAKAMNAANEAYASYTGEKTKYMLYEYNSKVVVLNNGVALSVYDSKEAAMKALYDDPVTTENEVDKVTLKQTATGWYIIDEGYSQHKYVAFGDSITYGIDGDYKSGEDGYRMAKPYPTLVGETLGIGSVDNQGKSGATLSAREGRANATERILGYTGEADIISVMLGVNDYSAKAALGDMSCRDNTTVYGSLHLVAQHLKSKYPNAFIFFMTPFKYKTENNGVYNLADVAQAVKDVAAEYNIPVLDMYTNGQFDPATGAKDQIHPTQAHHATYTAPMICEFIEQHYDPKSKK